MAIELEEERRRYCEALLDAYGYEGAERAQMLVEWMEKLRRRESPIDDWDAETEKARERGMKRELGELYRPHRDFPQ